MKYQEVLTKIGLSDKESAVYIALIELGPSTVSELSRKTGLHRPALYKIVPELQTKGLVSTSPKGKLRQYVAESPEKLNALVDTTRKSVASMIPELKSLFQTQYSKPTVKLLEGRQGIMFVLNDLATSLQHKEVYYRYSAISEEMFDKNDYYLPPHYAETMQRKDVECCLIMGENIEKKLPSFLWLDVKTVPEKKDLFDHNISQIIYADKVAFIDYNTETALIIENRILSGFQKKLFKLLYEKL